MIHCEIKACVGCRMCEVACSIAHFGAVSPALARIRVAKLEDTGIEMAVACLSCRERPCLECPSGALSAAPNGSILVDADSCTACRICVDACPVGAIGFHEDRPLICDLCGGAPACVASCPSGALTCPEDFRDVALAAYPTTPGNPSEKRAHYVLEQGRSLRASWKSGVRAGA